MKTIVSAEEPLVSYSLAIGRGRGCKSFVFNKRQEMVPEAGFEPAHPFERHPLKMVCLPVPPLRHGVILWDLPLQARLLERGADLPQAPYPRAGTLPEPQSAQPVRQPAVPPLRWRLCPS